MGEREGACAGDDAGTGKGAFVEIAGIDAIPVDLPEECGAWFDVGGGNCGGEGVTFFERRGGGGEFVGRLGDCWCC